MIKLERYIIKKILLATFAVILVASALVFVMSLLGELRQVGESEYGLLQAALYALLELPFNVGQFFPMLVLLGGLVGLGMLISQQELVVMRASGLSPTVILKSVFLAGIVLILFGFTIGEGVSPRLHYVANMRKTIDLSGGQAVATQLGLWVHQENDFIHIQRVLADKRLEGVTRYEFNKNHKLISAEFADSMQYHNGQWLVKNLARTNFPLSGGAVRKSFSHINWSVHLNPVILNAGLLEPDEISLRKLKSYAEHLVQNGMQAGAFQFSFVERVLRPLALLIMLFLAMPFVISPPRSLAGGVKLFLGVVVGFGFYVLNTLAGQLSVIFQLSPWLAGIFPIFIFMLLDVWLLWRVFR